MSRSTRDRDAVRPPGIRIERLEEAIAILRGSFADGPFSFDGQFYSIESFDCQPKPVQVPHPPFLIGGTRERVLRLATREADIVGLDLRQDREALLDAFPAGMDRRVGWVRDEAGDRFQTLELSVLRVLGELIVTDRPLAAGEGAREHAVGSDRAVHHRRRRCSSPRTRSSAACPTWSTSSVAGASDGASIRSSSAGSTTRGWRISIRS
jgi:alkanesulfonate monooxygenase SsuD/methylene tetrahydromethanopterin reductase-like flavin-dependent oxidoreductase (luciferase family)